MRLYVCVCVGGREGVGVSLCMLSYCCYGRIKQQCGSCAQGNNRLYILLYTAYVANSVVIEREAPRDVKDFN